MKVADLIASRKEIYSIGEDATGRDISSLAAMRTRFAVDGQTDQYGQR